MASEEQVKRREEMLRNREELFGDLHWSEDDYDHFNVNLGGQGKPYILIRRKPDGRCVVHSNIKEEKIPDLLVEMAFQMKEL